MKTQLLRKLSLSAGFLAGYFTVYAQETKNIPNQGKNLTIAVVDMSEVYDKHHETKKLIEDFQILAKQGNEEIEKEMQEAEKLFKERDELLKKLNNPATPDAIKKELEQKVACLDEEIAKKGREINDHRQKMEENLSQRRNATLEKQFDGIVAVAETEAKKRGFDIVLNKASVLYSKPEIDITNEVIEVINKPAAKNNKTSEAANKPVAKDGKEVEVVNKTTVKANAVSAK